MKNKVKRDETPKVNSFYVEARLTTSLEQLGEELRQKLPNWKVMTTKEMVACAWVESRDLENRPYKVILIKFTPKRVDVLYSVPPTEAPPFRRWYVVRMFLNVFSLVANHYDVKTELYLQLLDGVLDELKELVQGDFSELYVKYTHLKTDVDELRRRLRFLEKERKRLTQENYNLSVKYEKLFRQLREYTKLTHGEMKVRIQDWIKAHNGEIDIHEFSKVYRVPVFLVEKALDEMVREGYLKQL